jgi:hypothetical protein
MAARTQVRARRAPIDADRRHVAITVITTSSSTRRSSTVQPIAMGAPVLVQRRVVEGHAMRAEGVGGSGDRACDDRCGRAAASVATA